jgi:hypothetical protein
MLQQLTALPLYHCLRACLAIALTPRDSIVWISDIYPPTCQEIQERHYHTPDANTIDAGEGPQS